MILKLYIGNDKLDLFKDEKISINSSIADNQDITKNTTDFTKTFTVPASDENNRIFKHYYDATVDNTFDARTKISGRIELDGIPFKTGKYRLSKVKVKRGKAYSYTLNFWGNLIDIKSKLKKDELSDLNLSAYDHAFTSANVKTGLTTSLFSGSIIYNLLVKKQYFYSSSSADNTQTDALANIALSGGSNTGVVWNDVRPSIKLLKIIEAIETKYDLTFSRDFFGRAEFTNLYLWINSKSNEKIGGSIQVINFDGGSSANVNLSTDKGSFPCQNTPASNDSVKWDLELTVTPDSGNTTIPYKIIYYVDNTVTRTTEHTGTRTEKYKLRYNSELGTSGVTYEVFYKIETEQEFDYTVSWYQKRISSLSGTPSANYTTTASSNTVPSYVVIADNMPKIKSIDFLKALFNMFKLVVIPQDSGTIYVNTLSDYYAAGSLIDITKHIDIENTDISRGSILNEINFNFKQPGTVLNIQFEKNNNIAYGDEEAQLTDSSGEPLDGSTLSFKVPFEQVLYERLKDTYLNVDTQIQYGAIIDEDSVATNPAAHIFYNISTDTETKRLGFIDELGVKTDLGTFINTASHTDTHEDQQYSTLFSSEFSTWSGDLITNTLYSNYHQVFINNLFNIKRRNFTFKAELPLNILSSIRLNDILKIKYDYYRIDNFDIDLITGKTIFKLINAFETNIGAFTPSQTDIFADFQLQQQSIYVTFLDTFTYVKTDNGFGTAWITITSSGRNIFFDFTENITEEIRDMFITFTDTSTSKTFVIYLNQTLRTYVPKFDFTDSRNSQFLSLT